MIIRYEMSSYPLFYRTTTGNYASIPYIYNTTTNKIEPAPVPIVALKIVKATATSDDGNIPSNVLDNSENTRWSADGIGQKLFLDLGAVYEVHGMDITWYQTYARIPKAAVQLDNDTTAIASFEATEQPTTKLVFPSSPQSKAKVVTIICNGNNVNNWNSITMVKIYGRPLSSEPTPEPTPPTTDGLDSFGIKMLNPTITGGRTFFMPALATSTVSSVKRVGNTEMVMHGQGSVTVGQTEYKISGSAPRLYVYSTDNNKLWNDLEITCYYNIVTKASAPSYAGMTIGARSIHHLTNDPCDTYYSKHAFDQRCYFQKELVHPTASSANISVPKKPFDSNDWYGMKFILRGTKLEQWRDETDGKDGGTWTKVIEFTDTGSNWSGRTIKIGKSCFIRTDGVSDFRIKKFSIREI